MLPFVVAGQRFSVCCTRIVTITWDSAVTVSTWGRVTPVSQIIERWCLYFEWLRSWRSDGIKHKKNEIFLDVVASFCDNGHSDGLEHAAVCAPVKAFHYVSLKWPETWYGSVARKRGTEWRWGRTFEPLGFCERLCAAIRDPGSSEDEAAAWAERTGTLGDLGVDKSG